MEDSGHYAFLDAGWWLVSGCVSLHFHPPSRDFSNKVYSRWVGVKIREVRSPWAEVHISFCVACSSGQPAEAYLLIL